ncbi:MAG: IS200/IS605 family transposase [Anaerolineae bacterium]
MPYWRLFYHLVWTTKNREPMLTPDIELRVHGFLRREAEKLGAPLFFISGVADHVHALVSIRPAIAPAELVKQLKGSSSHFATTELHRDLYWQEGYGILSISEADVPRVLEYIKCQKQHHADKRLLDQFEQVSEAGESSD